MNVLNLLRLAHPNLRPMTDVFRRSFFLGIWLRHALVLAVVVCFSLSGCGLYQSKTAFVPYKAVAVTGSLSPELLYQLQFHILTYINIKVAIHP